MGISTRLYAAAHRLALAVVACVSIGGLFCGTSAFADAPAPGFALIGKSAPTELPPGGEGEIVLWVGNLGGARSESGARLIDTLPEGLTAVAAELGESEGVVGKECEVMEAPRVRCEISSIPAGKWGLVYIRVKVGASVPAGAVDSAVIRDGGALQPAITTMPVSVGQTQLAPGFNAFSAWLTNADGTPDTQAGSHPYDLEIAFSLNDTLDPPLLGRVGIGNKPLDNVLAQHEYPAEGDVRTINVNLPPGLIGDPQAVPQCTRIEFDSGYSGECPIDSLVGYNEADIQGANGAARAPVFNMVPPAGVAAQFAFSQNGIPVFIDAGVRTGGDNGVTTHVTNIPRRDITFNETEIWGVPGEVSHDEEHAKALLTLPTSCGAPLEFTGEILGTWEEESLTAPLGRSFTSSSGGSAIGLTGCERLQPFKPEVSIAPDTSYADTPAGLSVTVSMPQGLNPEGLSTPNLKDTKVVLPEGIAINPGQATGLVACQPSQEALGKEPDGEVNEKAPSCPSSSKVGTVEIESPLLRTKMFGEVYILQKDPPSLELMIAASADGVNLKLVGQVQLNEQTGQLVTTFNETPDFPFTTFKLNFGGGAQAALATPTRCGTYESAIDFTPWSTPYIEDALESSRFQVTGGPDGSSCVWPMPFEPTMTAGATTDQAGGYTDFTMLLTRGDEQQRIKTLSFKTPEGLLGMISKVSLCPEPQAAQGTCSSASQIGHTVVGAGPGPYPFYIPQAGAPEAPIYLTGPYDGAPFGLSIVVPLIAGPFDLGTEVVRGRIEVDPHTSQITITTNPLPLTEKGIPDDLRSIDAVIDRPEFMFNPTSCAPMSFTGSATSFEGATAPLSSHFQMGSCQALKFQPDFKVSTSGKTNRKEGASLTAKIVYPVGNLGYNQASSQSNIKSVKVDLPKQLPSRLTTLQKACPAKTFEANPASCPVDSIVGHGKAITPLLPVPVEGPAYFVSHAGEEFPNLIVVLQGDNVTVDLVGDTFIDTKTNITSSTFKEVPDVPIQSFELNLPQGKYSALAANTNLCTVKGGLKMPTAFIGQNDAVIHQTTPINVTGCAKIKPKKANTKKHSKKHADTNAKSKHSHK
jgi:hypothetical protein